jgi:hypothetical protein
MRAIAGPSSPVKAGCAFGERADIFQATHVVFIAEPVETAGGSRAEPASATTAIKAEQAKDVMIFMVRIPLRPPDAAGVAATMPKPD